MPEILAMSFAACRGWQSPAFGGEKALRIWLDPMKLHSYGLSVSDVLTAVSQQNTIVSPAERAMNRQQKAGSDLSDYG